MCFLQYLFMKMQAINKRELNSQYPWKNALFISIYGFSWMEFLQVDQLTQTKKHLSYLDVLFPKEKQVACSNDYFQMKLGCFW